ncbi:MAG: hypothetical protein FD165_1981 [Gammaproteobacteria bacterium]|nr:MAG: hypothetical protein FD165_1981 [Gammaproteobacteria bacterium]TND04974.1 MAG: hypothetical protein FD120_1252 [Gammaproteobacteria bacterium]
MNGAAVPELTTHDRLLVRDLRNQSVRIASMYLAIAVISATGLGLAAPHSASVMAGMFLCGALAGLAIEKLVTRRIRRVAWQLYVDSRCRFPGE